jgi:type III pantothenate kinase
MQGLVTLDLGNTNATAGIFQKHSGDWKFIKTCSLNELTLFLKDLEMSPGNTSMVLSQVKERKEEISQLQDQGYLITNIKDYWRGERFAGMPVHYTKTIGEDRLIQAFYLFKKIKKNCLLIDAGTFLTMDVITPQGFLGGYIIPGIKNYLETFKQGELLKDVDLMGEPHCKLPNSTPEAMRDSYMAFFYLAQKLLNEYQLNQVIISGGQCDFWNDLFHKEKLTIPFEANKNLIHHSLHYWMTTQIEIL